jgi:hypothetical protein
MTYRFRVLLRVAMFGFAGPAVADTQWVVTRSDDPAPDGCEVNDCSLREAMIAADATSGINEIVLAAATYQVGEPPLTSSGVVYITGAGSANTRIEAFGNELALFNLIGTSYRFTGLTLDAAGGTELSIFASTGVLVDVVAPNPDGAVVFTGHSLLAIDASDLRGRVSGDISDVQITNSRLTYLSLTHGSGDAFPRVALNRITIDGSLAPGVQSGLRIRLATGLSLYAVELADSTIRQTTDGANFSVGTGTGEFTIARLHYLENAEPMEIWDRGTAQIIDSEFSGNRHDDVATPRPGALLVRSSQSSAKVLRSTFDNNRGTADAGGAVLVQDGASLVIQNSTFSSNTFSATAAADGVRGGAIGFRSSDDTTALTLQQVTLVPPTVVPVGVSGSALGGYGGEAGLALVVLNSIFRGGCGLDVDAMDVATGNVSTATSCQFSAASNQVGVSAADIALGSLGAHGGYTRTFVPESGSVAIDTASAGVCLDEDQRGYARPLGSGCDSGAVETGDVVFANGFE